MTGSECSQGVVYLESLLSLSAKALTTRALLTPVMALLSKSLTRQPWSEF